MAKWEFVPHGCVEFLQDCRPNFPTVVLLPWVWCCMLGAVCPSYGVKRFAHGVVVQTVLDVAEHLDRLWLVDNSTLPRSSISPWLLRRAVLEGAAVFARMAALWALVVFYIEFSLQTLEVLGDAAWRCQANVYGVLPPFVNLAACVVAMETPVFTSFIVFVKVHCRLHEVRSNRSAPLASPALGWGWWR